MQQLSKPRIITKFIAARGSVESFTVHLESLLAFREKIRNGGLDLSLLDAQDWTDLGLDGQDPAQIVTFLDLLQQFADQSYADRVRLAP
jgi:hypothetical protein